jgi:hypothetical protein
LKTRLRNSSRLGSPDSFIILFTLISYLLSYLYYLALSIKLTLIPTKFNLQFKAICFKTYFKYIKSMEKLVLLLTQYLA